MKNTTQSLNNEKIDLNELWPGMSQTQAVEHTRAMGWTSIIRSPSLREGLLKAQTHELYQREQTDLLPAMQILQSSLKPLNENE